MRMCLLSAGVLLALACSSQVLAQDASAAEVEALREQVRLLQARLDALERQVATPSVAEAPVAPPAPPAPAERQPQVRTEGGLQVASADRDYSFRLGGRLHWDAYAFDGGALAPASTTDLRRARLSLQGKLQDWEYKLEQEFTGGSNLDGLRDAFIARSLAGGKLTIGHFKPYRSMDELSSSNEMPMMERSVVSASGLFAGRQYQQGAGWLWADGDAAVTAGISVFNLRNAAGPRNEGFGMAGRVTWAPIHEDARTLHLGLWGSHEDAGRDSSDIRAESNYASRRGPRRVMAVTTGVSGGQVDALGLEVAASFGPFALQSEWARARFEQSIGAAQTFDAYYVQAGWLFAGHRPYKTATGVFGAPSAGADGVWELVARYEQAENRDLPGIRTRTAIVGMNWYLTRYLRFMFDYTRGEDALNGDRTQRVGVRSQLVF